MLRKLQSAAVLAIWFSAFAAFAQETQVSGQILDESKSAIQGAAVELTRVETGEHRETVSSSEGYYVFPAVLPGNYTISAKKDGFSIVDRSGVTVQTGQISTVDITLSVGTIKQAVEVEAQAPLLETQSAAVGTEVENKTIVDMPLLDRRSSQLQRLSGFVVPNGTGSSATFAIAGGRSNNADYLIDGGEAQNLLLGVPILIFDPPVESVQEFNVAVSNYAAELGRTGGAVVQMTTKSGTNNFHGSAYEFVRNDALNTRSFFSASIPELRYNLFGVSVSGPIVKDRTQFFFNYEGRRQITATTAVNTVPSLAERGGNFTGDKAVLDPLTGATFASEGGGNVIPASRLDPIGLKLAAAYPVPNAVVKGVPTFIANQPADAVFDDYVARIDHVFGDKDRIFGRLLAQTDHTTTDSIFPIAALDPSANLTKDYYYDSLVDYFHTFTPTLFNEARFGYTQRQYNYISAGYGSNFNSSLGLTGVSSSGAPTVTVAGYSPLGNTVQQYRLQSPVVSTQYVDQMTWVHGTHSVKWGVEVRQSRNQDRYYPTAGGSFAFNTLGTGNSVASLLLGWVYSGNVLATEPLNTRAATFGGFIQDDWHVTSNFTLNYGLRYDLDEPRWEQDNRQNSFNPAEINPVSGTPGAIAFSGRDGLSQYATKWDKNNFGPRLGFAWNVSDKWVIRGGGGVLYLPEYDQATPIVANTGFSTQASYVSINNGKTPAFLLDTGFPGAVTPTAAQLTPGLGAVAVGQRPTTTITYFDPKRVNGYLYQTSFDVQREIGNNLVIDLGYLGTFGHHLPSPDPQSIDQVPTGLLGPGNAQVLRPFPQYSDVQVLAASIGASKYDGVNLSVDKRYSNGLHFQANYTFSKSLDNLDARSELANYPTEAGNPATNAFTNYYNQGNDWGLSGNDVRHRFVFSSVYELPFGDGKTWKSGSRMVNSVAGGWSLGVIADLRTGTPLEAIELTNNTNSFSQGVRPNVVGDPDSVPGGQRLGEWFNTAAFAIPAAYTFGDAGRTFGEGPGAISLDTSLLKDLSFSERFVAQFRVEGLNVLNHPNFANPDTRQGSPTFGQITSLVSGNQDRIIQLGMHLQF